MKSQRTEQRISSLESATATILGHPDVTVPCEILNFSKSGMCIAVADAIPLGNIVKVEWSGNFLVGRARRMTSNAARFEVGLELLYCSQWSEPLKDILESVEARAAV